MPIRKKKQSGNYTRAKVRQSLFVCVHRKQGDATEIDRITKNQRDTLSMLKASLVSVEPTEQGSPYLWNDWYRITIHDEGKSFAHIRAILHANKMFDGPHYGGLVNGRFCIGKEMRPVGQGVIPAHARSANRQRAAYRELEREGTLDNWELMRTLYGSNWLQGANPSILDSLNALSLETMGTPLPGDWHNFAEYWLGELKQWEKLETVQARFIQANLDRLNRLIDQSDNEPDRERFTATYEDWFALQEKLNAYLAKKDRVREEAKQLKTVHSETIVDAGFVETITHTVYQHEPPDTSPIIPEWQAELTEVPVGYNRIVDYPTFSGNKRMRPLVRSREIRYYDDNGSGI